ncbi:MAG TPA: hypothetical protein VGF56_02080 [Rhizomicrobium sp.]|jgi:hypothetical protein
MAKEPKKDLRKGMWERGPVEKGPKSSGERIVPEDADTVDIVRPGFEPLAEGQTTHQ